MQASRTRSCHNADKCKQNCQYGNIVFLCHLIPSCEYQCEGDNVVVACCCEEKIWWWIALFGYSYNNDTFQDCFATTSSSNKNGISTTHASSTRSYHGIKHYQNYQCCNLVSLRCFSLVHEGEFVVACAFATGRLDSLFFRDSLQNANQLFSLRLPLIKNTAS